MSYEPTLTFQTDNHPMPRVTIAFTSLASGTASLNVWRTARGRQMAVRGGVGIAVSGGVGLVDVEAPAVACSYFAEQFDSTGASLGFTGSSTITPTLPGTWVHNPFNPAAGVSVRTAATTGASVAGQIASDVYYPSGRRAGVAVTGQRRGIAAASVQVYTASLADADTLDAMFGGTNGDLSLPPFVCVRFSSAIVANIRLPQPLFLVVPSPTQTPVNLIGGGSRILWDLTGSEVDPPAAALAQTLLSRGNLDAYYSSRSAMDAAYPSRLAADTDYNLAGYGS